MTTRKPPTDFAIRRGRLIQRAREEAGLSQAQLAERIGVKSREVISQYESGKIEQIGERTCRALVFTLGLLPSDLAEDPSVFQMADELPPLSAEARRVARQWDALPPHVRQLMVKMIEDYRPDPPRKSEAKPRKR